MRILLWSSLYAPVIGGVERYTERLAMGLTRLGCAVEVVTNSATDAEHFEVIAGVPVTRLPFPASRQGDFAAIKVVRDGLRRVTERLRPEILNLQTSGPSILHYQLHRRALPIPLVTTFHGIYPAGSEMGSLVAQHLAGGFAITSSAATKDSLVAIVDDHASTFDVRLPPLADESCPPVRAPEQTALVLGVGRMVTDKGWETLIDAMPLVCDAVPNVELVLVGDGPDRQRLEALVVQRGLSSVVRFTGIVEDDELTALLDACNVACVPSHIDEGFGMVAIEASTRARPVVASRAGGLVEAVVDGETGLLVPRADPNALGAALVRVLSNRQLAEQLGNRGRQFSSAFTLEAFAAATLDTFQRVLLSG